MYYYDSFGSFFQRVRCHSRRLIIFHIRSLIYFTHSDQIPQRNKLFCKILCNSHFTISNVSESACPFWLQSLSIFDFKFKLAVTVTSAWCFQILLATSSFDYHVSYCCTHIQKGHILNHCCKSIANKGDLNQDNLLLNLVLQNCLNRCIKEKH